MGVVSPASPPAHSTDCSSASLRLSGLRLAGSRLQSAGLTEADSSDKRSQNSFMLTTDPRLSLIRVDFSATVSSPLHCDFTPCNRLFTGFISGIHAPCACRTKLGSSYVEWAFEVLRSSCMRILAALRGYVMLNATNSASSQIIAALNGPQTSKNPVYTVLYGEQALRESSLCRGHANRRRLKVRMLMQGHRQYSAGNSTSAWKLFGQKILYLDAMHALIARLVR
jgi:hypothetical protein